MNDFEVIVKKFSPMIYRIMKNLHIREKDEGYQIGLIALWKAYTKYDPTRGKFESYAYSTIRGHLQKQQTREIKKKVEIPNNQVEMINVTPNEEYSILLNEIWTILSPRQKQWFYHGFLLGKSEAMIAHMFGVTRSSVQDWKQGAKRKIRAYLKND